MSMNEVLALALQLSDQERAALAQQLLTSLAPPGPEVTDEQEWEAAWMEEIQRRMESYHRGETTARDWRESLEDIRSRLHQSTAHDTANSSES